MSGDIKLNNGMGGPRQISTKDTAFSRLFLTYYLTKRTSQNNITIVLLIVTNLVKAFRLAFLSLVFINKL